MRLIRTHDNGAQMFDTVNDVRDARQRIAWCGTDNLGMTKAAAAAAANTFNNDGPFRLRHYTFELVTE